MKFSKINRLLTPIAVVAIVVMVLVTAIRLGSDATKGETSVFAAILLTFALVVVSIGACLVLIRQNR